MSSVTDRFPLYDDNNMYEPYTALGDPNLMLAPYDTDPDFDFNDSMTIDDTFAEDFNNFPNIDFLCREHGIKEFFAMPPLLPSIPTSPLFPDSSDASFVSSLPSYSDESFFPMTPLVKPHAGTLPIDSTTQYLEFELKGIAVDYPEAADTVRNIDCSYIKQETVVDGSLLLAGPCTPAIDGPLDFELPEDQNPYTPLFDDYEKRPLTPMSIDEDTASEDGDHHLVDAILNKSDETLVETFELAIIFPAANSVESDLNKYAMTLDAMAPSHSDDDVVMQDSMTSRDSDDFATYSRKVGQRRAALEGTKRVEIIARKEIQDGQDEDGEDEVGDWDEIPEAQPTDSRKRKRCARASTSRPRKTRKTNDHTKVVDADAPDEGRWTYARICKTDKTFLRYKAARIPPEKCERCTITGFKRKNDMKRHLEHQHRRPRIVCPKCLLELCRKDALTRHNSKCVGKRRKRRNTQLEMQEKRKMEVETLAFVAPLHTSSSTVNRPRRRRAARQSTAIHTSTRYDY
ncbi:hypothetical protein ACEPAI_4718 [Sanghuangporus weigelae]